MTDSTINTAAADPTLLEGIASQPESWRQLLDVATVELFLTSGNCTLTLLNTVKSTRVTIRATGEVQRDEDGAQIGRSTDAFAVRAVVGRDNGRDVFLEIGRLERNASGAWALDTWRRSTDTRRRRRRVRDYGRWQESQVAVRTVNWLLERINNSVELPASILVFNAGRCRECGKELRVPTYSNNKGEIVAGVAVGLGPVCCTEGNSRDSRPAREVVDETQNLVVEPVVDRELLVEQEDAENPVGLDKVETASDRRATLGQLLELLGDDSTEADW